MFISQADFAKHLAKHLWHETCHMGTTEQRLNLLIVEWLLDTEVRFRHASVTTGATTTTEQQSQK